MKIYVLSATAFLFFSLTMQAQKDEPKSQTATFEDGTKIDYTVIDNIGDDLFKNTIVGFSQADGRSIGTYDLMYERFDPEHFLARGEIAFIPGFGFGGLNVGGIYFFGASVKDYKLPIAIREESNGTTTTRYVIKTPSFKNRHFGADFSVGFNKNDVTAYDVMVANRNYRLTTLSAGQIAIGGGYLTTKQSLIHVEKKNFIGGSHSFQLTADIILNPGVKFAYTTSDSISAATPLVKNDFIKGGVGFRVMIQGQTSFKVNKKSMPTHNIGFFYRLGAMKTSLPTPTGYNLTSSGIVLVAALGLFGNFGL